MDILQISEGDINQSHINYAKISTVFSSQPIPTEVPAIPTYVHFGLTVVFTILYSLSFIIVYVQLMLILWYKHKRFSYQSVFLFLCLLWAALRTTLFTFYFKTPDAVKNLSEILLWLFYCLPICLQFVTLSLLVLYFSQVTFNPKTKYEPNTLRNLLRACVLLAVAIFITTNISCSILISQNKESQPYDVITARVFINEFLFLICGVSLGVCVYKLTKTNSAKLTLETKGTTLCQTLTTCVLIIFLYVSRAAYNIIVVALVSSSDHPSYHFGWINITDQSYIKGLNYRYVTFGAVLFAWEFLPTFIVVVFFRVKKPKTNNIIIQEISNARHSQPHFFDNPRRYDSDDELFKSAVNSYDYVGPGIDYHIIKTSRLLSPYGSFHSSYLSRHGSWNHVNTPGTSSSCGSQQDRPLPCPPTPNVNTVIKTNKKYKHIKH